MEEYENEAPFLPDGFQETKSKVMETELSLRSFLHEMDEFENLYDDWLNWYHLAMTEFHDCKNLQADTIQHMSNNLDRIQVNNSFSFFRVYTLFVVQ